RRGSYSCCVRRRARGPSARGSRKMRFVALMTTAAFGLWTCTARAQYLPPRALTHAEAAKAAETSAFITHGLIGTGPTQGGGPLGLRPLDLAPLGLAQRALPGQAA